MFPVSKNDVNADWRPTATLETLTKRAMLLASIRKFFADREVLEVETPCLGRSIGTDVHLDFFSTEILGSGHMQQKLYLQTSPEFAMKRLLAAGSGSIYQICKAYRNQDVGRHHNPEFSLLEWYRVGFDLHQLMDEVEDLVCRLFGRLGATRLPSERLSYRDVFFEYTGIDCYTESTADFEIGAKTHGLVCGSDSNPDDTSFWLDFLFSHLVQPQLGQNRLTFIYDYPACQSALARIDPAKPKTAERMELFIDGIEMANGYYELRDPMEHEQRFRKDLKEREIRGLAPPNLDQRFLDCLRVGLPECAGVAIGLDRILMVLTGATDIEQVVAFPINRA